MQYRVLTSINHDEFPVGSLIDLTDEAAAQLLAVGAIEPAIKPFSAPDGELGKALNKFKGVV